MKKLFLVATLCVAGLVSAKTGDLKKIKKKNVVHCTWCVAASTGNYCAEAADCTTAKQMAREMALSDQPAPQQQS